MGPSQYSQYTRADFGPEALGSSIHTRFTSPNVKTYGRVKSHNLLHFLLKSSLSSILQFLGHFLGSILG